MKNTNKINEIHCKKVRLSVYKPQSPFERLRLSCKSNYEALYKAILLQAIIDASGFCNKSTSNKKNLKSYKEAYYWIFNDERNRCNSVYNYEKDFLIEKEDMIYPENSFEDICQKAGLCIKKTLNTAEKIIKNHNKKLYDEFFL